jgi:tetratricopeptide (TPR) repeat protein
MGLSYLKVKKARIALQTFGKGCQTGTRKLTHIFEAYKDALGMMAIKHYHGGDYTLAADMLGFLKENKREDSTTLFYLASSLKAKGITKGHLDIFEELYENNPEDHSLGLQLGELYHRQGYEDDAKEIFAELGTGHPSNCRVEKITHWKFPLLLPYQYFLGRTSTPRPFPWRLNSIKIVPRSPPLRYWSGNQPFA